MINGKIEVLGKRHIMLPSDLLFTLQQSSSDTYSFSKKRGFENMKYLGGKLGASQEGMLNNIKNIYETFGLGILELVDLKNKEKQAAVIIRDSPLAKESPRLKDKTSCLLISGILAGMFTYFFGTDVDAKEKRCFSSGATYCEFVVKKGGTK